MNIKKYLLCFCVLSILMIFISGCSQIAGEASPIVKEWVVDQESFKQNTEDDPLFCRVIFLSDGSFMLFESLDHKVPTLTGDWEYSSTNESTGTLVIKSLNIKFPDGSIANSLDKPVSTSVSFGNDRMILTDPPVGMFSNYTRALSQAEAYEKIKKEIEAQTNLPGTQTDNNKSDNGAIDPKKLLNDKINEGYRLLDSDLYFIKKDTIKDTKDFVTDNGESLINHEIYIYSPTGSNGIIFLIDTTSGKVYESNGKNINGDTVQTKLSIMNKS